MRDYFLPHKQTHQKAHLLTWHGFIIYILIFMLIQAGLNLYGWMRPGVLGISSNVDARQLIELTNQQRQKNNLPLLKEDSMLDLAAAAKAKNMFEENYWAHYSPSGKDPWGFINRSGYKFMFAGENLARNFYNSDEVVNAWMESPSHRANILNSKYQDIGIAVVEGTLNGVQTVLVVQEFGSSGAVAVAPAKNAPSLKSLAVNVPSQPIASPLQLSTSAPIVSGSSISVPAVDPYMMTKGVGILILLFVSGLLLADLYILRRRGVVRIGANHLAHFSMIGVGVGALLMIHPGAIL